MQNTSGIESLKPFSELAIPPSTNKMVVLSCVNMELIENISVTVTDEI